MVCLMVCWMMCMVCLMVCLMMCFVRLFCMASEWLRKCICTKSQNIMKRALSRFITLWMSLKLHVRNRSVYVRTTPMPSPFLHRGAQGFQSFPNDLHSGSQCFMVSQGLYMHAMCLVCLVFLVWHQGHQAHHVPGVPCVPGVAPVTPCTPCALCGARDTMHTMCLVCLACLLWH
jgi:hypothetical protein